MGWMLLFYMLEVLKWLIVIRAVLSWFTSPHSRHPAVEFLRRITDPILRPISNTLPHFGGIDMAPLVAFFVIILLQGVVARAMHF